MDRQAPHAASLTLALAASALWTGVLIVAPAGGAITWLAATSAVLILGAALVRAPMIRHPVALEAVVLGLSIGLLTLALTHLVGPLVLRAVPAWADDFRAMYTYEVVAQPRPLLVDLALTLVVVLGEELVWRGLALSALRARVPDGLAIILSAMLYAVCQLGFERTLPVAAALALGLVWGWLRVVTWRAGWLAASVLAHATWTLGVLWLWPLSAP